MKNGHTGFGKKSVQPAGWAGSPAYKGTIGTLLEQNVVSGVELQATVNGYGVSPDKEIQGFLVRQEKRMQFGRHGKHNMEIRNVEQIETLVFNPPFF